MVQRIVGRLRNSIDASGIVAVVLLVVVLSQFGLERVEIATLVSAMVVGPVIADAVSDGTDTDPRPGFTEFTFGVLCIVTGVVHLRSASSWLGWVFVAVGGWLLEELREADRPLTKTELCNRTGLLEDDFERLLEIHGESGSIERVGNGYAIDESEMGIGGVARMVGRRLLRPIRLIRPAVSR
ncbi:hypothetical protein [Natrinema sp. DC36]|uniref:hypothetical protein n=1 Tax=Natrinema sp. DC36 TaxID=2878680 RepID=UPI001CEFB840|nr:hypothetical protein [Natrinema sp. DC36]